MERRHPLPLVLAGLFLVSLAGCLSDDQVTSNDPATSNDPDAMAEEPAPAEASPELEDRGLKLNDCSNGMAVVIYLPKPLYPAASAPSGWSNPDDPLLVVNVWLQSCARVSVGPFERGPVHFLIEMHDNMVAPDNCQDVKGEWYWDFVLTQFWLDDQEIVDYLRAEYLLPAKFAAFNVTQADLGMETRDTWAFGIPGQPSSTVSGMMMEPNGNEFPTTRLYYFPTPETAAFMDLDKNVRFSGLDSREIDGKLSHPLLYASTGTGDLVAYGGPDRDGRFSAKFHLFDDMDCSQPA